MIPLALIADSRDGLRDARADRPTASVHANAQSDAGAVRAEKPGPLVALGDGRYACRAGCGACCIALSISSPIPGMPNGKPAGVRCIQLSDDNRCSIFGRSDRPTVCGRLRPMPEMCGASSAQALANIAVLERATAP